VLHRSRGLDRRSNRYSTCRSRLVVKIGRVGVVKIERELSCCELCLCLWRGRGGRETQVVG
jgi:hypothetical protein